MIYETDISIDASKVPVVAVSNRFSQHCEVIGKPPEEITAEELELFADMMLKHYPSIQRLVFEMRSKMRKKGLSLVQNFKHTSIKDPGLESLFCAAFAKIFGEILPGNGDTFHRRIENDLMDRDNRIPNGPNTMHNDGWTDDDLTHQCLFWGKAANIPSLETWFWIAEDVWKELQNMKGVDMEKLSLLSTIPYPGGNRRRMISSKSLVWSRYSEHPQWEKYPEFWRWVNAAIDPSAPNFRYKAKPDTLLMFDNLRMTHDASSMYLPNEIPNILAQAQSEDIPEGGFRREFWRHEIIHPTFQPESPEADQETS